MASVALLVLVVNLLPVVGVGVPPEEGRVDTETHEHRAAVPHGGLAGIESGQNN
jgi:hypothetical protein